MARRTLISVALKFAALGLGFGTTAIMARSMEKADLGLYSFGVSIIMILGVLAQFGLPTLATREMARRSEAGEWGIIVAFGQFSTRAVFSLSIVSIALGYLTLAYLIPLPDGFAPYILPILLIIPVNAFLRLASGQVRGLNNVIVSQLPELLIRPGILFVSVLALYFAQRQAFSGSAPLKLGTIFWIYGIAAGLGTLFAIFALRRTLKRLKATKLKDTLAIRPWVQAGIPLMLTSGVVVLNQNLDVLIVGAMAEPEDIAVYRVSTRLTALVAFGLAAVAAVAAPQISRRYYAKDMQAVRKIARRGAVQSLLLALPFVAAFLLFPEQILVLAFGADYAVGASTLRILCIGQLINAAFGVLGVILNMTGQERYTVIGVAIAAVVATFLNLILVPQFGINGAALAQTVSFAIWNGLLAYFIYKRLDIVVVPFLPRKQD